jgi:hypothetical protein
MPKEASTFSRRKLQRSAEETISIKRRAAIACVRDIVQGDRFACFIYTSDSTGGLITIAHKHQLISHHFQVLFRMMPVTQQFTDVQY